ncbi:hypothetical protein Q5530_21920 [Saccharothrix sp. BKS2]|uniref:hypothetical protein n=1 Tax=Saccharothrix sp. BKS2 TaxID=3064400 RepID=UPI0039E8F603
MRDVWPFRRAAAKAVAEPPALPVHRGEWRSLPPVQRVVPDHPLVNPVERFSGVLASWRSPGYLVPLGHRVDADGPSGVVEGVVQRVVETPGGWGPEVGSGEVAGAVARPVVGPVVGPAVGPVMRSVAGPVVEPAVEPVVSRMPVVPAPPDPGPTPDPAPPSTPRRGLGLPVAVQRSAETTPTPPPPERIEFAPPPPRVHTPPPATPVQRAEQPPTHGNEPPHPHQAPPRARAPAPEELLDKLYDPLVRRLKAELWLDRERRGSLTDRWH